MEILPASLVAIAAGLSYGLWLGFALSATWTLPGGWLTFMLSRSILRPWLAQLLISRERLAKFDGPVTRDGWRLVSSAWVCRDWGVCPSRLGVTQTDIGSLQRAMLASGLAPTNFTGLQRMLRASPGSDATIGVANGAI